MGLDQYSNAPVLNTLCYGALRGHFVAITWQYVPIISYPRYRHVGDTTVDRADFTWQNFEHFDFSFHFPEGVT